MDLVVESKMLDWTQNVDRKVHSLGCVAYVPKIQIILIFLEPVRLWAYEYFGRGKVLKVTHNKTVPLEGKKYGNLYHFVTSMDWERSSKKDSQDCFQISNGGKEKIDAKEKN